ncbi:hypothetical protein ACIRL2_46115 [Embleya sp. NPDC127516]|uniref:hypothetical protein n=1 Tax=Embleya sp. NPDC127516 TaxID=3363990 RepID=UPI0037F30A36
MVDATAAHGVRQALLRSINALPDHVVDVDFDLSDTVLDDAGTAAIGAARRHAFLLGLRPGHPTAKPIAQAQHRGCPLQTEVRPAAGCSSTRRQVDAFCPGESEVGVDVPACGRRAVVRGNQDRAPCAPSGVAKTTPPSRSGSSSGS